MPPVTPYASSSSLRSLKKAKAGVRMAEGRILIVEDDVELAETLGDYFESRGYEVKVTHLGEEAVSICRDWVPEIVIQDIRLPDIDGYEVVRHLQQNVRTRQVGVVFLTELTNRDYRLRGLKLGAVDYITKPFDLEELGLRVSNAIKALQRPRPFDPITNLLRREALKDELFSTIKKGRWVALRIVLQGIEDFRDFYGFVAGDDLLRAVALVINNTLNRHTSGRKITGLLGEADFLLVIPSREADRIEATLRERIGKTVSFFFPAGEFARLPAEEGSPIIKVKMGKALLDQQVHRSLKDIEKATEPLELVSVINVEGRS